MKLFMSPTSPYARKCRIIARELDLMRMIEEVAVDLADKETIRRFNPLGKIPALALDDGSVLFDSPVICEYLDDLGGGKFFPKPSIWGDAKGRWRALTLAALGDGLMDAAVLLMMELRRDENMRSESALARHGSAIDITLDALERLAPNLVERPTIGEIAVGCALGYVDLRHDGRQWRASRPQLAAWEERFSSFPSAQATKP